MAVNYKLRDDIKGIIVCLYNPSGQSEETQYTFSELWDYVSDCYWQLAQGERIKRYPFHVAPCKADAEISVKDFKSVIASLRKEKVLAAGSATTTIEK